MTGVEKVRAVFDREIASAEEDCESATFIGWLEALRNEVADHLTVLQAENERLRTALQDIADGWCDGCSPFAGSALVEAPEDWQPLAIRQGDRITIDGETYVVTAINPTGHGLSLDLDAEERA